MAGKRRNESGDTASRRQRVVRDPLFADSAFFNPADPVQVKYEMLRRVQADGMAVAAAARNFGFSRVAFYAIRRRLTAEGLSGLIERPRGPRSGHKLTPAALAVLAEVRRELATGDPVALAAALRQRSGVSVHPRTVQRALKAAPKKGAPARSGNTERPG